MPQDKSKPDDQQKLNEKGFRFPEAFALFN